MQTPSLRRRVVALGVGVLVLVMVVVDVLLYLGLRSILHDNLDDLLAERARLVQTEARVVGAEALASRLTELGIRATVRTADGRVHRAEPPSPILGSGLPPPDRDGGDPVVSRDVQLSDGGTVVVFARRAGVDDALSRLLYLQLGGLALAVAMGALLFSRASFSVMRPLREMADAARRTSLGSRGERLRPDRPSTNLGRLATAYDEMLASLEAAVQRAEEAQAASDKGREAAARLAAIVESAREAIFSTSLDGTLLTWNRGAEQLYGFTAEEAIGRPASMIVSPNRREELARFGEQLRQGHPVLHQETVARCRNGTEVEVAMTISPVQDADGTVVATSTIVRDLTEQRWMASTLNATLAAVESSLDEARESEARSRRFLADAAHQLRNPIAGIRACAETLLRGTTPDERDRLLANLVRETSRASRLMTSLLQLARLDQGHELAPEPTDVMALCLSEVERARALAPDLEIDVLVSDADGPDPEVDPNAVREILANLLDNARRHAVSRIEIAARQATDRVELRVVDDGSGVPDEMVHRIFDRFVSVDGRGGSGLGLPIARALARAHGGDLVYNGEAFVLWIPMKAKRLTPVERS